MKRLLWLAVGMIFIESYGQGARLDFLGEQIISNDFKMNARFVGGLSSIDYKNGEWISVCDSSIDALRFYQLDLHFSDQTFKQVKVVREVTFKNTDGVLLNASSFDPEGLRFYGDHHMVWSSEGNVRRGVPTQIFICNSDGEEEKEIILPEMYTIENCRHNGLLENLSLDPEEKGVWFANELPLVKDGVEANYEDNHSAFVRFNFYDFKASVVTKQFAYSLDKVVKKPKSFNDLAINGLVEILSINENQFLCLERSYTSGYGVNGTSVKLYLASVVNETTDVRSLDELEGQKFNVLKKELLLDFDTIKNKLPSKHIDNIEGMCFGPEIKGKKTLVFISDNNFNLYKHQITQVLVFTIEGI